LKCLKFYPADVDRAESSRFEKIHKKALIDEDKMKQEHSPKAAS
jgi:hypothetical protein